MTARGRRSVQVYELEPLDCPPEGKPKFGRRFRFPFDTIEVGKGFIVLGMNRNTLSPYRRNAERATGKKFTTRKVEKGVAVWRMA